MTVVPFRHTLHPDAPRFAAIGGALYECATGRLIDLDVAGGLVTTWCRACVDEPSPCRAAIYSRDIEVLSNAILRVWEWRKSA